MVLGLLLGLWMLWLGRREFGIRTLWLGLVLVSGAALILLEAHRSVWIAAGGLLVSALAFGVLRANRVLGWFSVIMLGVVLAATMASTAAPTAVSYIAGRGTSAISGEDTNGLWRESAWKAAAGEVAEPLFGVGLGGWWSLYLPDRDRTWNTAPHNFYVQTFVKLGVAGLASYLWLVLALLRVLVRGYRMAEGLDRVLAGGGLACIAAWSLYMMFYSLDPWAVTFLGLAIAAALNGLAVPLRQSDQRLEL